MVAFSGVSFNTGKVRGLLYPSDIICVFMLVFASSFEREVLAKFVNLVAFCKINENKFTISLPYASSFL
jgi:hypothetical protein